MQWYSIRKWSHLYRVTGLTQKTFHWLWCTTLQLIPLKYVCYAKQNSNTLWFTLNIVLEKSEILSLWNYPKCLSTLANHSLVICIILNPPSNPHHPHPPSLCATMKHPHDSPRMNRGIGSDSSSITTALKPCILVYYTHKELTGNYTTQGWAG